MTEETMPSVIPSISQKDLDAAGFPTTAPMAPGLAVFFNDALYSRCTTLARLMSRGEGVMPKHLINKPEACFAIISRSITTNMDPFAVAMCTYQTPGGSIGYEGKLVQAILENSGKLDGGVKFEHLGDWSKVKGKFKIMESQKGGKYPVPTWTLEDAKGLSVVVSAKLKVEAQPRTLKFDLDSAFPLNSPLWATAPERQICYTAVRAFASTAMPGVLLGMPFDVDPGGFYEEPKNITPPRPKAGKNEFDREAPAATETATKAAEPETVAKDAKPAPAEPEKGKDAKTTPAKNLYCIGCGAFFAVPPEACPTCGCDEFDPEKPKEERPRAKEAEPPKEEPKAEAPEQAKAEPASPEDELALWYKDQLAELEKCKSYNEVRELADIVVANVEDALAKDFKKLCSERAKMILDAALKEANTVKAVTDLKKFYATILPEDFAKWFDKMAADRQRAILDATRKVKK